MKFAVAIGVLVFFVIVLFNGFNQSKIASSKIGFIQPSDTAIVTVPPVPDFPSEMLKPATQNWTTESNGTYDLLFTFANPNSLSVSLAISSTKGIDPGNLADTTSTHWEFTSLTPNTILYVNMKAMVNGTWSQIASWSIQVPVWKSYYPTPTPYVYENPTAVEPRNRFCYQSGNYTFCNDGTSFITSGNSTFINGGVNGKSGSCITSGSYTSCSDGSSGIQNGNFGSYYGNGQSGTCIKSGAWTNCSDGSSTYNPGY